MRTVALVVMLVAGACEKSASKAPAPAPGPAPAPREPTPNDTAGCPDAEIKKRMDESFAAIKLYFGEIEKRVPGWSDCEVARKDLLALEPTAEAYYAEVMKTKNWGESLGPACKDRAKQLGKDHPEAKQVDARFSPLEPKVKDALERCKDHPGFQEAATKGLRVLKKKTPSP